MRNASWLRIERAVRRVRERLMRAAAALEEASLPYAVIGGNAVALWVSRVDEAAVRNTRDVDLLLRSADLEAARRVLAAAGFVHRHAAGVDVFVDGAGASPREGVQLAVAGERVRPDQPEAAPDVMEAERAGGVRLLKLPALVRMKLAAFRDQDRMHLRDLIAVGLVERETAADLPERLRERLLGLLDDPEG